jgi:hypothetical protein
MVDAMVRGMTAYTQRMWATQDAEDRFTMLSPTPVEGGVPVDVFAVVLDDPLTAHLPPFVYPAELSAEKLVSIVSKAAPELGLLLKKPQIKWELLLERKK